MESIKNLVSKNFNRLFESSGMRPKEVIERLKIDKSTFSRWRSGEAVPEAPNMERIASLFRVDPIEFYKIETETTKVLTMSAVAKRISSMPDGVYELAVKLGSNHKIWEEEIIPLLEEEIDIMESQAKKKNQQA